MYPWLPQLSASEDGLKRKASLSTLHPVARGPTFLTINDDGQTWRQFHVGNEKRGELLLLRHDGQEYE